MQVDPNASSSSASSSSTPYGGWPAFPSPHATSPAFNSFGQPQHGQQQLQQQQQYPAQGFPSLKRTRSNDGSGPEPSAKRPQFQHHAASAPFLPPHGFDQQQAQLHASTPGSSFLEQQQQQQQLLLQQQQQQQQHDQQLLMQQQQQAAVPELARMEDMGAGVSFMGYAAHELHAGGGLDDGDDMEMEDDCTNPMPWGSSRSTHFPENAQLQGVFPRGTQTFGLPSQTPASTPHHSPHQGFASLPPLTAISALSPASATYSYGSPRPLQPPPPASKPQQTGGAYTMGPRADCEKCQLGVKGHYGHIGAGGR